MSGIQSGGNPSLKNYLSFRSGSESIPINFKNLGKYGEHQMIFRYQKPFSGPLNPVHDSSGIYAGNNDKALFRYKYQLADRLRIGITAEKDAGEKIDFSGRNRGFDYYSGHLTWKGKGIIRQIILGDYAIQFGQGLMLWSGLSYSKTADVINIQKQARGIYPYSSTEENIFFRGLAVRTNLKKLELQVFGSFNKRDANLIIDPEGDYISSLQTSGYHRSVAELEDKDAVKEISMGTLLSYYGKELKAGIGYYTTHFSLPLIKSTSLYNKFQFAGKQNDNYSVYLSKIYRNIYSFSEIGMSGNNNFAFLSGIQCSLHPDFSASLLFRTYSAKYQALRALAFSENTSPSNEKGIYYAFQWRLKYGLSINTYIDLFSFPWLKFQLDAPSSGHENLIQLNWKPKRKFESLIRFQQVQKVQNELSEIGKLNYMNATSTYKVRWQLRTTLNENWSCGSRAEWTYTKIGNTGHEKGFLLAQDLFYHPLGSWISGSVRCMIFNTGSYDTRIYTYENDVLYSSSVPAFQGQGSRFYINTRIRLNRNIDLWLKYSETTARKLIIAESKTSEWKVQLRYKW